MDVILCSDPLNPRNVESHFDEESKAAASAGLKTQLIDFEALAAGDITLALRSLAPLSSSKRAVYRGWMLTLKQYETLYLGLQGKGRYLITSPSQYAHCHHFPNTYSIIKDHTPKSVFLNETGAFHRDQLAHACASFGAKAIVIKDYVKSQKHYWSEACYVPRADDLDAVERVLRRFVELQGEFLVGGIVFREFVPLKKLGVHPKSKMPLSREFRIFFLNKKPISILKYWDEASDPEQAPNLERFLKIGRDIQSPFFAMDVAETEDGDWLILELGDGQVSGLSEDADLQRFYKALANGLQEENV